MWEQLDDGHRLAWRLIRNSRAYVRLNIKVGSMLSGLKRSAPKTLIEWLILTAVITVLIALLLPEVQWASSGFITIPVEVTVFDSESGEPIENASVYIVRSSPGSVKDDLPRLGSLASGEGNTTNESGMVTVQCNFSTGANNRRPEPHAHTNFCSLVVGADGYDTVVVPVREHSIPTSILQEKGRLPVRVGLVARKPQSGQ